MAYLVKRGKIFHIYYYDPLTQRTKSFSAHTSDRVEARKILKNFEAKKNLNLLPDNFVPINKNILFSEFLSTLIPNMKAIQTIKNYKTIAKNFIKICGDKPLYQYSIYDFEKYIHRNKHLSQNTIASHTKKLNHIFNEALKRDLITKNYVVKVHEVYNKDNAIIPHEELQLIFNSFKQRSLRILFQLAYYFALRTSEVVNLQYEDFDLDNRILKIRNIKVNRIDLVPILIDAEKFIKENLDFNQTGKLFNYSYDYLRKVWRLKLNKLGLNYNIHDLRKTRGTHLAEKGVNPYYLKKLMRHTDIKTTLKHYINIELNKMREDTNKLLQ
jgi:integrase